MDILWNKSCKLRREGRRGCRKPDCNVRARFLSFRHAKDVVRDDGSIVGRSVEAGVEADVWQGGP